MDTEKKIEQILQHTEQKIQRLFNRGCVDYKLLEDGDRILVALSGGKDSLMLLRLLAARSRIHRPSIHVEAAHVVMDNIPYESDHDYLQQFCYENGVKLHILHSQFDDSIDPRKTRCYLCAQNRRRTLFHFAVENGFNKVALGHHQDDILTTFLMNLTFEGSATSMMPSLQMEHFPLTIIRPLCLVHESDIEQVAQAYNFHKQKAACPYEEETRRKTMNDLFHQLQSINPEARYSLWRALMKER